MNFYFAVLLEPENFIQKDEKKKSWVDMRHFLNYSIKLSRLWYGIKSLSGYFFMKKNALKS